MTNGPEKMTPENVVVAVVIIGAAIIFGTIGYNKVSGDSGKPKPKNKPAPEVVYEPKGSDAIVACRNAVRESLKAPRSAEFKGMFDSPQSDVQDLGRGRFRVASWVDAQNSFGAMIRQRFECVVDMKAGRVETLTID